MSLVLEILGPPPPYPKNNTGYLCAQKARTKGGSRSGGGSGGNQSKQTGFMRLFHMSTRLCCKRCARTAAHHAHWMLQLETIPQQWVCGGSSHCVVAGACHNLCSEGLVFTYFTVSNSQSLVHMLHDSTMGSWKCILLNIISTSMPIFWVQ